MGMSSSTYSVCIFVSSSDRTRDVFERVFANFDRLWSSCPLARFVGFTTPGDAMPVVHGFGVVAANSETGWRQELAEQLEKLPTQFDRILLLLDDFLLLEPVDTARIMACLQVACDEDMAYLRLKPLDRSWLAALARRFSRPAAFAEMLSPQEPYHASLQAAVWRKDHLLWCLAQPGSIWQFEHLVTPRSHWAVRRAALPYRHVVEKGRWMADAALLFRKAGLHFDPGQRASWPWSTGLQWHIGRMKFGLFGYFGPKMKRWVRGFLGRA